MFISNKSVNDHVEIIMNRRKWQNPGFFTQFLTKSACFDERKMTFLAAKSFGA